ncbi:DUF6962 family protein [Nodosilinea nodulosa]|uniref:DUF6962 family protein n=1 Tax=Nodosilinea nodulosa TaxID=416001 RepID=UPI00031A031B|nr:hypothetical protein [Nodosilinea nodulosa]
MAEPLTTLTDYAIALECLVFAGLLLGRAAWLWAAVFISVSGAAALGGTYHGFAEFLSWPHRLWLWQGIGLGLSLTSFLAVVAAASPLGRGLRLGLLSLAAAKLALVTLLSTSLWAFALRVADYLSALAIVLLVQLGQRLSHRHPKAQPGWLAAGIAISGLAACVLLLPPEAFIISPLAGYHLVQMVALYCIYRSVKGS